MALSHTDTPIADLKINKFSTQADFEAAVAQGLIGDDEISMIDENIQSDWNQNDSNEPDYIKNKPDIAHQYRKDYFVSGLNPIDIEYDTKIFGEYPPIRIYTEWDVEIFGDIKYTLISGTLMRAQVYFNQSPSSGYYILG